jgi:hypothetical protein
LSERYVVCDTQGVFCELEVIPPAIESQHVFHVVYYTLLLVGGVKCENRHIL